MQFTFAFGWWLVPLWITVALFALWRVYGVRMQPTKGGMFPDALGALLEFGGYLVAALLSVIVWLIYMIVV